MNKLFKIFNISKVASNLFLNLNNVFRKFKIQSSFRKFLRKSGTKPLEIKGL
jgi:hypothetical protein